MAEIKDGPQPGPLPDHIPEVFDPHILDMIYGMRDRRSFPASEFCKEAFKETGLYPLSMRGRAEPYGLPYDRAALLANLIKAGIQKEAALLSVLYRLTLSPPEGWKPEKASEVLRTIIVKIIGRSEKFWKDTPIPAQESILRRISEEDDRQALEYVGPYLSEPVDFEDLLALIERETGRKPVEAKAEAKPIEPKVVEKSVEAVAPSPLVTVVNEERRSGTIHASISLAEKEKYDNAQWIGTIQRAVFLALWNNVDVSLEGLAPTGIDSQAVYNRDPSVEKQTESGFCSLFQPNKETMVNVTDKYSGRIYAVTFHMKLEDRVLEIYHHFGLMPGGVGKMAEKISEQLQLGKIPHRLRF